MTTYQKSEGHFIFRIWCFLIRWPMGSVIRKLDLWDEVSLSLHLFPVNCMSTWTRSWQSNYQKECVALPLISLPPTSTLPTFSMYQIALVPWERADVQTTVEVYFCFPLNLISCTKEGTGLIYLLGECAQTIISYWLSIQRRHNSTCDLKLYHFTAPLDKNNM